MPLYELLNARTGLVESVFVDEPVPLPYSAMPSDVNAERNRRMRGTFAFQGKPYDCDEASLMRITGAATQAGLWLLGGGDPASLTWHGGAVPFVWIAADNTETQMDAATVFAFGKAASANEAAHIFAARALKQQPQIPADFADDKNWPARAALS